MVRVVSGADMSGTKLAGYFWIICALLTLFFCGVGTSPLRTTAPEQDVLKELSDLFGIKRIPADLRHKIPPEYMTELYRNVAYEDGITKSETPYGADVVRGFPDRGLCKF